MEQMFVSERVGDQMVPLISMSEAAELLAVSQTTLRRLIDDGAITPRKSRIRVGFDRAAVMELRERRAGKSQPATADATPTVAEVETVA